MPRAARIVIPELPHHITQRGNRRQTIFYSDDDRKAYCDLLKLYCEKTGTRCLAWCLMDNHVHLILVPPTSDALRATLAGVHTTYVQRINRAHDIDGHLFQGRFASYPMDAAHLWVAVRYVELNPVRAGLVSAAQDWPWSSARAHIAQRSDGLTDVSALGQHVGNWSALLERGLEASDEAAAIADSLRRGTPIGEADWRAATAAQFGITLNRGKRGPKGPRNPAKQ